MESSTSPINISMPNNEPLLLALLTEELKSRRFFNTLLELGLDNSYYQPHLTEIILACLGLNDDRNETMEFFCAVMDEHANTIGIKPESVRAEAAVVYEKLIRYRTSMQEKGN